MTALRTDTLRPVTNEECNRCFPPLRSLGGSFAPDPHGNIPWIERIEIAGVREFLKANAPQPLAEPRWYSFRKVRREIARWINAEYFPGDSGIPREGISHKALILAADLQGYECWYGGLPTAPLELCILLSFTPEYERLRRERLRAAADLHAHIFGG